MADPGGIPMSPIKYVDQNGNPVVPSANVQYVDQYGNPVALPVNTSTKPHPVANLYVNKQSEDHPPHKIFGVIPHEIHGNFGDSCCKCCRCCGCCDPCCRTCCGCKYYINPIVMFTAVIIIWSFVIWCAADTENASEKLGLAQDYVVRYFGWFYIASLIVFGSFSLYVCCSKYGNIKLGPENEPPKYSLMTWFSMLFSAGIGVGLYYFGVAEPVWHFDSMQKGTSRWYHLTTNQQAMEAMNVSWFHWGFTASATYCAAALPLAYHHHVKGEPLRESTCFSALIGQKYAEGIIGCIIDLSSVIGTMFGVATSLGLGVLSINAGLDYIFGIEQTLFAQLCIIWVVTAFATISVLTGLDVGIRRLSEINFGFSFIVLFFMFFALDPFYLLNLFIQGIGYHFQWILQLTFDTSAFEQCGFSEFHESDEGAHSAQVSWMADWTIFYWAWWIAWAPFVGIFIAQISRGRTIREFIIGNMMVPTLLTCVWLCVFGGVGLYNELGSIQNGIDCDDPEEDWYSEFDGHTIVKLSCFSAAQEMLYATYSTLPLSKPISIISMIGIVTYFVTSSDSASHVIDILTAAGNTEPPKVQRIFWALSEGAVASVLLATAGGDTDSLTALQTASLVAALPFTVVLLFEVMATYKTLLIHTGELNMDEQVYWTVDLFEVGTINVFYIPKLLLGLVCPPFYQMRTRMNITEHAENRRKGNKYEGIHSSPINVDGDGDADGDGGGDEEMADFLWNNNGFENNAFKYIWICGYWILWGIAALFLFLGAIFSVFDIGTTGFIELGLTFYAFYLILCIGNRNLIKGYYAINSSHIIFDICSWSFCWCCAVVQEELQSNQDVNLVVSASVMKPKMMKNGDNHNDKKDYGEDKIAEEQPERAHFLSSPKNDATDNIKEVDNDNDNDNDDDDSVPKNNDEAFHD